MTTKQSEYVLKHVIDDNKSGTCVHCAFHYDSKCVAMDAMDTLEETDIGPCDWDSYYALIHKISNTPVVPEKVVQFYKGIGHDKQAQ